MHSIVMSAYKEPANKELPVIGNCFLFLSLYQGISTLHVYKELRLYGTGFHFLIFTNALVHYTFIRNFGYKELVFISQFLPMH